MRAVAVLDRTKEPGAPGEPLRLDVLAALADAASRGVRTLPRVVGGRYGLSSKEFTPAMVRAVLDSLGSSEPRDGFTVGIVDDVTHTSLPVDPSFTTDRAALRAVFYGLGSDGTVGANKQTVKIVGEHTDRARAGLLRLRLEEVGFDDRVAPPLRRRADPLHVSHPAMRTSWRVTSSVSSTASTCSASPRPARRSC